MKRLRGFTLLEVLAALALLGSTLAVLLTAQQHSLQMLKSAELQKTAHELARELINDWRLQSIHTRRPTEGRFSQAPNWHWERRMEPADAGPTPLARITLTILHRIPEEREIEVASLVWLDKPDA